MAAYSAASKGHLVPRNRCLSLRRLCSPSASAGVYGGIRAQYANEPVAAPEFRVDEIAIRGQCFAQGGDLNLEAPFRHSTVRPHPSEKLFFCEEHAICLEQDQKEVEGARTEHDWNAV